MQWEKRLKNFVGCGGCGEQCRGNGKAN